MNVLRIYTHNSESNHFPLHPLSYVNCASITVEEQSEECAFSVQPVFSRIDMANIRRIWIAQEKK